MQYVYIDYENLNKMDKLTKIQGRYFFFIGNNQSKIDSSLVESTNGLNVTWIKISGSGKNALDFHIAYYLAKNDSDKNIEHFILSKDTGFDPLIDHLNNNGVKAKRIETLKDISKKKIKAKPIKSNNNSPKPKESNYEKTISALEKTENKPKEMKKLKSYMRAQVRGLSEKEIENIINEMLKMQLVVLDENSKFKYFI